MTSKLFSELGLSPALLKAIDRLGYEKAAPIQSEAIPLIMSGSDVVGQSHTGSGKTAAFGIPAVELVDPHLRAVQVIILCPTRELAVQVAEEIFKLSIFKRGVQSVPIYGGQSYDRQIRALQQGDLGIDHVRSHRLGIGDGGVLRGADLRIGAILAYEDLHGGLVIAGRPEDRKQNRAEQQTAERRQDQAAATEADGGPITHGHVPGRLHLAQTKVTFGHI